MTSQNNLEIKGNLQTHPLAELLLEAAEAGLTGSFRLSFETNKIIVYLNGGKVVFAVSNARRHRLFEILLYEKKFSQTQLVGIPNFANDLELSANLQSKNLISAAEINRLFSAQIEGILKTVFDWSNGEWIFSSQTRIRENIHFEVNLPQILLKYARSLPDGVVSNKLKDSRETFGVKPFVSTAIVLLPAEAFVLSRFEKSFLSIREIESLGGLSDSATTKILYTLWLGGFLFRQQWQAAFSERKVAELLSAKLSLKKETSEMPEKPIEEKAALQAPIVKFSPAAEPIAEKVKEEISLDEYLKQVEKAVNHYEVLNVAQNAELKEIKPRYFMLAKQFHPDMFHKEKDSALLHRIQAAFARTAQAYETLKDAEARKVYDYKLDKNLIVQKPLVSDKPAESVGDRHLDVAKESFELGFSLLMEEEYEDATPLLARAAQLTPNNAKYRCYYGKALSADETQRYKADTEMQAAIKLDPQNLTYRLVSTEFYIQYGLFKRAEGELKRLLVISPNHPEALKLLKSLPEK